MTIDQQETGPGPAAASSATGPALEESKHLKAQLAVLRKHIWVILLFLTAVVAGTAFFSFRMKPIFRAQARIEIPPPSSRGATVEAMLMLSPFQREYFNTKVMLIRNRDVLGPIHEMFKEPDQTFDDFAESLDVEPLKDTNIVDIGLDGTDRERITEIVNRLIERFAEFVRLEGATGVKTTQDAIVDQILLLKQRLDTVQADVAAYQKEHGLQSSIDNERSLIDASLSTVNSELRSATSELRSVEADFRAVAEVEKAGGDFLSLPLVSDDPAIRTLMGDQQKLEQQIELLSETLGPNHPTMLANVRKRAEVGRQLETLVQSRVAQVRRRAELQRMTVATLTEAREGHVKDLRKLDGVTSGYELLQRESIRLQTEYDRLARGGGIVGTAAEVAPAAVIIRDRAILPDPDRPVRPRIALNLAAAVILGLIGGVLLAFFLDYLDDSVRTTDDVRRHIGLPVIGSIPTIAGGGKNGPRELVTHQSPRALASEAFRAARTGLTYALAPRALRMFLVTSAGPREGKTTSAINLAIAFAQTGERTLLIEADLRHPRFREVFPQDDSAGLTSVLTEGAEVEDAARSTDIPHLFILPGGPVPPNPAEMLASDRMREFLDQAREKFDRIIIDSPPALAVTDASILAVRVDGILQVIQAGATSRGLANHGKGRLTTVGGRVLGVLLTQVRSSGKKYAYYGYGAV